jgi:DNA polymerase
MSLNLDARQRAMLAEMGVSVWQPKSAVPAPTAPAGTNAVATTAAPSVLRFAPTPTPSAAALTPLAALTAAVQAESAPALVQGLGQALVPTTEPAAHASAGLANAPDPAVQADPASTGPGHAPHASPAMAEAAGLAPIGAVFDASAENISANAPIPPVQSTDAVDHAPSFNHVAQLAQAAVAPLAQATAAPLVRADIGTAGVNTVSTANPAARVAPAGMSPADTGANGPVASMGWPALREAVHGCQACGLCHGRTQTVFGVGAERADWLVVGEAPGEQEDLRGEPFVGPAGQLLDAMLRAVGKDRQAPAGEQAVFIANVLKCRPPGNRNPTPDEVAQCEPYLRRQVELVQPKLILALGRFAVQALLNTSEPIGRLRQQVHRYQGVPVIVSYHPAYLLRSLPDKAKAWADLVLAMRVANEGH